MEQQRQTEPVEPRFDRTEAEEALLIAARLQQEHHEQFSLTELKKTAAEVDISPEFVDQALRQMQAERAQASTQVVTEAPSSRVTQKPSQIAPIALGIVVVITQFVLIGFAIGNPRPALSAWILALMLAGSLAWKLPRGSAGTVRGASYLGVAFALILALLMTVESMNPYEHSMEDLARLLVMAFLQTSLYFAVRWLVSIQSRLAAASARDHPTESRLV